MARAGGAETPPARYFRGCDLTAEWLFAKEVLADGHQPGAIPGDRTKFPYAERQLAQPSLQNLVCLGQHQGGVPIFMGSWQTSNALALQARLCGSVTRRFHQFQLRGE